MDTTTQIGCTKDDLDTPALCIDLEILDANIRSVADYCRRYGVGWRPHCKCHKSPAIARKQIQAGAIGITCAKLGEAEVLAGDGVDDFLIANLITGDRKLRRLVALRRRADPVVCVDHPDQAESLGRAMADAGLTLRVLVEVDIGLRRVGVLPGEPALALARHVERLPGLEMAGVMGYEGHLLVIEDLREKEERIHEALDRLVATKNLIEDAGIHCGIVSCGGTGSYLFAAQHAGITEIQAGGAIFMDAFYRYLCQVPDLGYAVTVLTTVVSRPAPDRAIVDAGRKTLNKEQHMPLVAGRDDIAVEHLSAEHGRLRVEPGADLKIGDRLELIPGYVDFTTMLHDEFYGFQEGRLQVIWPIEGRGKIR